MFYQTFAPSTLLYEMPTVRARVVYGGFWEPCWWLRTAVCVVVSLVSVCVPAAGNSAMHESAAAVPDRKAG